MSRLIRAIAIGLALLAGAAGAQTEGDEFLPWPSDAPAEPVPRPEASPAPLAQAQVSAPVQPPAGAHNRWSLYSASTLGQWNRGLAVSVGFPLVSVKAAVGVSDSLDLGIGFDTLYGVMNEPRAFTRWQWLEGEGWSGALVLEGGMAFFAQRPETEQKRGARALTGRRNFNAEGGVVFSYRGKAPRAARLFADLRYHLAFDTQAWSEEPLGGVPPAVVLGSNVPVRLGAEMPFSSRTSFMFAFGFDLHGRNYDFPFMPVLSVGVVTGV
ncbi:MAG: hypothetical protein WBV82_01480 [Myxococcaceae bacterium]